MNVTPIKTRVFVEGEDLISFITKKIKKIPEGSVIVVTSKIVALAESRTVENKSNISHDVFRENIIRNECEYMIRTPYTWLTIKDGMVMASAGVDESNADGKIILLPKDSYRSANFIRKALRKYYKIKNLGVLITDSRLLPLRAGVTGVALGYAGFRGVRDYIGTPDIFGRKLEMTRTDIADALATSAVLEMGEGREQQPLALITGARIDFVEKINKKELHIDVENDIYGPLFRSFGK